MQRKKIFRFCICLVCIAVGSSTVAKNAPRSPRKSELLSLLAGGVLPENIVNDIRSRGLNVARDDTKSLLRAAGADPKVFAALNTAKTASGENADSAADTVLLQHLRGPEQMIRAGQYDDAANELAASLRAIRGNPKLVS